MRFLPSRSFFRDCSGPAGVALVAVVAIVVAIDPAGDFPNRLQGPGLTLDESFNVEEGVRLSLGLRAVATGLLSFRELFGQQEDLGFDPPAGYHNPDHPPLGRLCIGIVHDIVRAIDPPVESETPFAAVSARTASALAFAALILLTGWMATRWYGRAAGLIAAVSLVLMPRLFGHAHLAALETFIGLAYAAAVFVVADCWKPGARVSGRTACLTGVLFGLALLTKIQAILIPIPFAIWALWHWRGGALWPLLVWSATALGLFFLFWPWLWLDPLTHFKQYLGSTTDRVPVFVWYFGQRYADVDVPWHYPFVLFLSTLPVGLHLLGAFGCVAKPHAAWKEPREQLLLGCVLFPLLLFSLPGIAVYDGTRLFLIVFPLWGVFIGKAGAHVLRGLERRWSKWIRILLITTLVAVHGYGLFHIHPCYLSYYNLAVGGLRGAGWLGLDVTYWRDSVTRELLLALEREVPPHAAVILVPVLHPVEMPALVDQSPILRRHGVRLRTWSQVPDGQRKYVLLFQRTADIPPVLQERLPAAQVLAKVRREGVSLATLYELKP